MSQQTLPETAETASPNDRKVTLKDNAGGRHRMPSDKPSAATKSSSTVKTTGTRSDNLAPAEPTTPLPTTTSTEEPRTGEKRVRSDSASSLSTQPVTTNPTIPGIPVASTNATPAPPTIGTHSVGTPIVTAGATPGAQPAPTSHAPRTPIRTTSMTSSVYATPQNLAPLGQGEGETPSPPYQARMTSTYAGCLNSGATPPPHHLEPVHHTFHADVPPLIPNPNHPHRPTDEVLARLQALRSQRTRKCDPQDSLTAMVPTPQHGWPRVYHDRPDFLYTNLPDSTLDKWLAADNNGKKIIVQVMRQNSWCSPQCDATANLTVKTLEAIYGFEGIKVATASEQIRGCSQQNAPFSFLVFGLSAYVAEKILEKHCIATEHIQFLAYPLIYAATPSHLGSVSGLRNIGDNPDDMETLCDDLANLLLDNKRMFKALTTYAEDVAETAGDAIMDREAAALGLIFKFYIETLETKSHGGIEEPTINLFLELPASAELDKAFPMLVEAATRIAFETPLCGTGRFFPGYLCFSCRGRTHPTGLCPFEAIEGWAGITRPDRGDPPAPPPPSHPGAPPPPPSPRNPGPPPSRRDNQASSSKLPAPSFRASRRRPSGRG